MRRLMCASTVLMCVLWSVTALGQERSDGPRFVTSFELGFVDVLSHSVQFGRDGTEFDYVKDGGQDVLFSFVRLSGEFSPSSRHHIKFLYQPLEFEGRVRFFEDVKVNETVFAAGTPVDVFYGFPFYRLSYMYDVAASDALEVSLGGSLQLRNATISFTSADGQQRVSQRDVGFVPILKARVRYDWKNGYWAGLEADGFYAPVSYLNGDDNDVVGAILDASIRGGYRFGGGLEAFFNIRYVGGGGSGANENPDNDPGDDGYVVNWLHLATISLGINFDWTHGFGGHHSSPASPTDHDPSGYWKP